MARIPKWDSPKGHGTEARAKRHYRDGEKPCARCREAQNLARARRGNSRSRRLL